MKALAVILVLQLCSCSIIPTPYGYAAMMGGKGALNSQKDGSVKYVYDNEASFRDGALLAGLAVGAWQSVAATKATEATTQLSNTNATKQAVNASNNATKEVLGAQDVTVKTFVPP